MNVEQIEKRIAELKAEREQLVAQANMQLGRLSGAIDELERLITPQKEEEPNNEVG